MADDRQAALDRHGEAVATVRAFSQRSGAARVVLLVDAGDGSTAAMIDCGPGGDIELTEGERTWDVAADLPLPALPRAFPALRPPPSTALQADPDTGELEAPLGVVANLGAAVLGLAAAFGGRTVATAEFATRDPRTPITIAAREGEPLVLAAGNRRFVLP